MDENEGSSIKSIDESKDDLDNFGFSTKPKRSMNPLFSIPEKSMNIETPKKTDTISLPSDFGFSTELMNTVNHMFSVSNQSPTSPLSIIHIQLIAVKVPETPAKSAFGQTTAKPPLFTGFSAPDAPVFGQSSNSITPSFASLGGSSNSVFEDTTANNSVFEPNSNGSNGQRVDQSINTFRQPEKSVFGSTLNIGFGQAQGASQPSAFGTPQPSAFGTAQPSAFGTAQPSVFGTSQSSSFGTSQSSSFGTPQTSAFGISQSSAFGISQSSAFGTPQPSAFGTPGTQQPIFGSSGFSVASTPTSFGSVGFGSSLFANQPNQPSSESGFNAVAKSIQSAPVFGSSVNTNNGFAQSSGFGAVQNNNTVDIFGQPSSTIP
jgi:hypothetical protein